MTTGPIQAGKRGNGRIIAGLISAGLGRKSGFSQFGGSTDAFLATLAPLLGFLIVACGTLVWSGFRLVGLTVFLILLCNILAPPVLAELFCRLWRRRPLWARYANVLNCMPWLILALLLVLMPLAGLAVSVGVPSSLAGVAVFAAVTLYGLWFNWFAARHVLDLSAGRAIGVTLGILAGTTLLMRVPDAVCDLAGVKPGIARLQDALDAFPPEHKPGKS